MGPFPVRYVTTYGMFAESEFDVPALFVTVTAAEAIAWIKVLFTGIGPGRLKGSEIWNKPPKDCEALLWNHKAATWLTSIVNAEVDKL